MNDKIKGVPKIFLKEQLREFNARELDPFISTVRDKYESRKPKKSLDEIIGELRKSIESAIDDRRLSDPIILRSDLDKVCGAVRKGKKEAGDSIHKGNPGLSGMAKALRSLIEQRRSAAEQLINERYDLVDGTDAGEEDPGEQPGPDSVFGMDADREKSLKFCIGKLSSYLSSWFEGFSARCREEGLIGNDEIIERSAFEELLKFYRLLSATPGKVGNSLQVLHDAKKDCNFETMKGIVVKEVEQISEEFSNRNCENGARKEMSAFIKKEIVELILDHLMMMEKSDLTDQHFPADTICADIPAKVLLPEKTGFLRIRMTDPEATPPALDENEIGILKEQWRQYGSDLLVFKELKRIAETLNDAYHGGLEYRDPAMLKKYFTELQAEEMREHKEYQEKLHQSLINSAINRFVRAMAHEVSCIIAANGKKEYVPNSNGGLTLLLVPKSDFDDFSALIRSVHAKLSEYFAGLGIIGNPFKMKDVFEDKKGETESAAGRMAADEYKASGIDLPGGDQLIKQLSIIKFNCAMVWEGLKKGSFSTRPCDLANFDSFPASLILGSRFSNAEELPMLEEERKILMRLAGARADKIDPDIESRMGGWAKTINDTLHGGYPVRKAADIRKWLSSAAATQEQTAPIREKSEDAVQQNVKEAIDWVKSLNVEAKKVKHGAYRRLVAYASLLEENRSHLTLDQIEHLVMEIETARAHYLDGKINMTGNDYKELFLKSPNKRVELMSGDHVSGRLTMRLREMDKAIKDCEEEIAKNDGDRMKIQEIMRAIDENASLEYKLKAEAARLEDEGRELKKQYMALLRDAVDLESADKMDDVSKTMDNNRSARNQIAGDLEDITKERKNGEAEIARLQAVLKESASPEKKLLELKAAKAELEAKVDQLIKDTDASI